MLLSTVELVLLGFVSVGFVGVGVLLLYARWNYGVLESLGIPVVKRSFFLGSTPDLHSKVVHLQDIEWFKQYGPIYGVYQGRFPQVHICDPELIEQIFVKDYEYFHSRKPVEFGNDMMNELIDWMPDEKWKTVRSLLTPAFSLHRIKLISQVTVERAEEFVNDLRSECRGGGSSSSRNNGLMSGDRVKIDLKKRASALIVDIMAKAAFGIEIENRKDPNNKFVHLFKTLMGEDIKINLLFSLSLTFPFLAKFTPTFSNEVTNPFRKTMQDIVGARRKSKDKIHDFIEVFLGIIEKTDSQQFKKLGITEDTVITQALGFMLAGYDTISTVIVMLSYYLAKNQDIQSKLYEEINSKVKKNNGRVDHEMIIDMPYLTACLNEALRLCPPFFRPERLCTKDWEYNGVHIKKGINVIIPLWAAHRNPNVYSEPETFNPDRHLPGNRDNIGKYDFSTFGHGPKNCIAIRFSYELLKLVICILVKGFRIELDKDVKFNFKKGTLVLYGYDPVYFELIKRD